MTDNLTNRQKELVRKLVIGIRNNEWGDTFWDVSSGGKFELLAFPNNKNISVDSISDMDVIASVGLAIINQTSNGTKKYTLTQAAFNAVDNDFSIQKKSVQLEVNQKIGVQVMGDMRGGNVFGIGHLEDIQIDQIINDPEQLKIKIEELTSELIDVVKNNLDDKQLVDYKKITKELKEAFQREKPNVNVFRKLIGTLSLINDTTASIDLISKILPYIAIIIQFAIKFLAK